MYTQQWYMSYRFVDSFRAGPGWNCSSILVLLENCLQTCMTYTTAECTLNKLLVMDRRTFRNMYTYRVSCQNKFVKLVHLVGFIIKSNYQVVKLSVNGNSLTVGYKAVSPKRNKMSLPLPPNQSAGKYVCKLVPFFNTDIIIGNRILASNYQPPKITRDLTKLVPSVKVW